MYLVLVLLRPTYLLPKYRYLSVKKFRCFGLARSAIAKNFLAGMTSTWTTTKRSRILARTNRD